MYVGIIPQRSPLMAIHRKYLRRFESTEWMYQEVHQNGAERLGLTGGCYIMKYGC